MDLGTARRRIARIVQKLTQTPIMIEARRNPPLSGAFIAGTFRSGTTLLRYLLDSHPRIAVPPETYLFEHILAPLRDQRCLDAMWNAGFHRETLAANLGECCRRFLEAYALSKGKDVWAEKTPSYVNILEELHAALPEAKFILVYRHPCAIVQSMMDRDMVTDQPEIIRARSSADSDFTAYCSFVNDKIQRIQKFERCHPSICYSLRYEHLTSCPRAELGPLCGFLGVEFVESMLDFQNVPHDAGYGDEKIHHTTVIHPQSHAYQSWSARARAAAQSELGALMNQLGYTL